MIDTRSDRLVIAQGITWAIRWPLAQVDGSPVDTTGWTVKSQIRSKPESTKVLHEWSTEKGNAVLGDGFLELRVSPVESSEWFWGNKPAVYDVEATTSSGDVIRLVQGEVIVQPEVTR